MRTELRSIQKRVGLTFIYITHDQGEALAMSDRVAVMNAGTIEQVGEPEQIYERPKTSFVASFVGENNVVPGRVAARADGLVTLDTALGPLTGRAGGGRAYAAGEECLLFIRPERLTPAPAGAPNAIAARKIKEEFEGSARVLFLDARGQHLRLSLANTGAAADLGEDLTVAFAPGDATVLPTGVLSADE
jgi:spermidine/putrescine transport system ATP-binding protein